MSERLDYYAGLYGRRAAHVEGFSLTRGGLGVHYGLQALAVKLRGAPLHERVGVLRQWLQLAGIPDPDMLTLRQIIPVCQTVRRINQPRGKAAWELLPPEPDPGPRATRLSDYEGRPLARIVDMLARHYGWSHHEILDLAPEVALAHVQECILEDRRQRAWEHMLSEISWQYDKASKTSRYKPLPEVAWDQAPPRSTQAGE